MQRTQSFAMVPVITEKHLVLFFVTWAVLKNWPYSYKAGVRRKETAHA
jgi:hypothetical protein